MGNGNYVQVVVIVAADTGEHRLEGPWTERPEAEKHLSKIRDAQESTDLIDLPWLSVSGARVIAAMLTDHR